MGREDLELRHSKDCNVQRRTANTSSIHKEILKINKRWKEPEKISINRNHTHTHKDGRNLSGNIITVIELTYRNTEIIRIKKTNPIIFL